MSQPAKVNIELKAYRPDSQKACETAKSLGGKQLHSGTETDTYFRVARGRLKIRQSEARGECLIYYERLNMPQLRTSRFDVVPLPPGASLVEPLSRALATLAVVTKQRAAFEIGPALINVDSLEGLGEFVELEVDAERAGGEDKARQIGERLKADFHITAPDMVPWSYVDLKLMHENAGKCRARLQRADKPGTLFLFDGASCSGKTTLVSRLAGDADVGAAYVPRYCTRLQRATEKQSSEYRFVSGKRFEQLTAKGAFIEYRDFEFGMSYGLPWKETMKALLAGRNAVGIINLGNIAHVKRIFPEAVTILIDAPLKDIEARLTGRREHTPSQIEERLANARSVEAYRPYYDHVVCNPQGGLEQAFIEIRGILAARPAGRPSPENGASRAC